MKNQGEYTQAQSQILRYVFQNGKVSRAQLARALRLSNLTVINGVRKLLEDGLLAECGILPSERGRRVTLLSVNPELRYFISADIGASTLKLAVVRFDGSVAYREKICGSDVRKVYITPEQLREHIARLLRKYGKSKFYALCFSISGTVDYANQCCRFCANIQGWNGVNFSKEFGEYFHMPVYLDSSGHCAAMAERQFGCARDVADMLYVSVGSSICTGIIVEGNLLRGATGAAGELGHIQLSDANPLDWYCTCGKQNCLEMYVTFPIIKRQIYLHFKGTRPGWDQAKNVTNEMAKEIYGQGHPVARRIAQNAGSILGRQIGNLANLFNPRMIVLGGGTISAFPNMVDAARDQINKTSMQIISRELTVERTALGDDGALLGATLLAIYDFLDKSTRKKGE